MLNRKSQLRTYTPMKKVSDKKLIAGGGFVFSTFTGPRTPLAKFGRRARKQQPGRRKAMAVVHKRSDHWCELRIPGVCTGRSQGGHELEKRSAGGAVDDVANLKDACNACNGWVEDHPIEAQAMGFSIVIKQQIALSPNGVPFEVRVA